MALGLAQAPHPPQEPHPLPCRRGIPDSEQALIEAQLICQSPSTGWASSSPLRMRISSLGMVVFSSVAASASESVEQPDFILSAMCHLCMVAKHVLPSGSTAARRPRSISSYLAMLVPASATFHTRRVPGERRRFMMATPTLVEAPQVHSGESNCLKISLL